MTCSQVAQAYHAAVPDAPRSVSVFVQAQGRKEPVCSGTYDATGKRTGEALQPPDQGRIGAQDTPDFSLPAEQPFED